MATTRAAWFGLTLLCLALPSAAAISRVQSKGANGSTVLLNNSSDAGNTIVVNVFWGPLPSGFGTVTDDRGDTYSPVLFPTPYQDQQTFYAAGIDGGTLPITLTVSPAWVGPGTTEIMVVEYSGIDSVYPVDAADSIQGVNPGLVSSGVVTTTSANDVLCAYIVTGSAGVGAGFNVALSYSGDLVEDAFIGPPGPYTATSTVNNIWRMNTVAFRPTGSFVGTDGGSGMDGGSADAGTSAILAVGCACDGSGGASLLAALIPLFATNRRRRVA